MSNKVIIIAEAGVNHNGDFENAKKLILAAANAGADYVKFQTFKADKLVSIDAQKAEYQKVNLTGGEDTQYEMLKKLEMSEDWHYELIKYAEDCGIKFLSTGFDESSIDFLVSLNIDLLKVPSGEITNKPYLEHIAKKNKPIIISTGMSSLEEIDKAVKILADVPLAIAQSTSTYPCENNELNLRAIATLGNRYGIPAGYSGHERGVQATIAAVALGATFIERHITLDRSMWGTDHSASLEPAGLERLVRDIRIVELALGDGAKRVYDSEIPIRAKLRRVI